MNTEKQDIRNRITEISYDLYRKNGIQNVTMDDIARGLGVSKRTIYESFRSKKEILYRTIEKQIDEQEERRVEIIESAPNVISGMIEMMLWLIRWLEKVNPVMFTEMEKYYPEVAVLVQKDRDVDTYQEVVRLLKRGIDEQLFLEDIDIDIVARLFLGQLDQMSNYERFPTSTYPRSRLFEHLFIYFLRGIVTEKGRRVLKEETKGLSS